MQLRVGLGNRRKVGIISFSHFASSSAFSTTKAKPNMPPSLLLFLLTSPQKHYSAKIFPSNPSILSYCFHFLLVVFLSQVSFHAVPTASYKDQETITTKT